MCRRWDIQRQNSTGHVCTAFRAATRLIAAIQENAHTETFRNVPEIVLCWRFNSYACSAPWEHQMTRINYRFQRKWAYNLTFLYLFISWSLLTLEGNVLVYRKTKFKGTYHHLLYQSVCGACWVNESSLASYCQLYWSAIILVSADNCEHKTSHYQSDIYHASLKATQIILPCHLM